MVRTVLVTGANRGLGLEFARQYLADGWRVHACCRRPDEARDLGALMNGSNGAVRRLDVRDGRAIRDLRRAIGDEAIDVLVNNAGIFGGRRQSVRDLDYAMWEETVRTNVLGPYRVAEALADRIEAGSMKTIANISSLMGSIAGNGSGGDHIYRTSKTALNMVTANLARDLAGRGIAVLAFHPGWARTDMGGPDAAVSPAESVAGMRRRIAAATPGRSGRFLDYDGRPLDW